MVLMLASIEPYPPDGGGGYAVRGFLAPGAVAARPWERRSLAPGRSAISGRQALSSDQ
jgi:hypothetical protein